MVELNNGIYQGYETLQLEPEEMAKLYDGTSKIVPLENEYIKVCDTKENLTDILKYQDGIYKSLSGFKIKNNWSGSISPRNVEQRMMFDSLDDRSVPLKIFTGRYGSGRTFISINKALELIDNNKFDKIVYVRNNINVKGTEGIGFLPGGINEKMLSWLMPIADIVGGVIGLQMLLEKELIEAVPLNFIRGRSFTDSIIISDESENLTKELWQLIIGRGGENSELWFLSDFRQTDFGDNKYRNYVDGTSYVIEKLKGERLVSIVDLHKTERSALANLSNLLD